MIDLLTVVQDHLAEDVSREQELRLEILSYQERLAELERLRTAWGFWPGPAELGGESSWEQNFARVSASHGRPEAIRDFPPGSTIPINFAGSRVEMTGATTIIQSYSKVPYDAWISGTAPMQLASLLGKIPGDRQFYYCLNHESQSKRDKLTPLQIRKLWDTVLPQLPSAPNLHPTLIPMEYDIRSGRWSDECVADGIECIAWDAYLGPWTKTPEQTFEPCLEVSARNGATFAVAEVSKVKGYAIPGFTEEETATLLVGYLQNVLSREHNAQFITWFESNKSDGNWLLTQYATALQLWNQGMR